MSTEFIQKILSENEIECSLEPSNRHPGGRVLVFFPSDHKQRDRSLEITSRQQILGGKEEDIPYHRIQFEAPLPFTVKEQCSQEIASFLFFLNRQLELPGFELDEGNGYILYRYVLLTPENDIKLIVLKGIIGSILLILDLFGEGIEKVAAGETTFNEILEKILATVDALA